MRSCSLSRLGLARASSQTPRRVLTLCGQIQFVAAVTVAVIAFVGLAVVNRLEEIPDRLDQLAAGAERAPEPPS